MPARHGELSPQPDCGEAAVRQIHPVQRGWRTFLRLMTSLVALSLQNTRVSVEGVKRLQQALPKTAILANVLSHPDLPADQ